jgi:hypothetical protein
VYQRRVQQGTSLQFFFFFFFFANKGVRFIDYPVQYKE